MLTEQNPQQTAADVRQQVRSAVQEAVQAAKEAKAGAQGKPAVPQVPVALPPVPPGGGRVIIDKMGDRTVITSAALPPDIVPIVSMAQETALGLMGLLAAMVILGPLARVFARRLDRKADLAPAQSQGELVQQQLTQLQQAVDTMALEVERISEAQRFQTKLLNTGRDLQP